MEASAANMKTEPTPQKGPYKQLYKKLRQRLRKQRQASKKQARGKDGVL